MGKLPKGIVSELLVIKSGRYRALYGVLWLSRRLRYRLGKGWKTEPVASFVTTGPLAQPTVAPARSAQEKTAGRAGGWMESKE